MFGLPDTNRVLLFSVQHKLVGGQEVAGELRDYFVKKGYDQARIIVDPDATIEAFRSVPWDCSVLFLNSHSSYAPAEGPSGSPRFMGIMTATPANRETLERYADEIRAGLITTFVQDDQGWGDKLWISPEFIRRYWRFPRNSIVFIHACMSFNEPLRSILLRPTIADEKHTGCGAGVFCGWTWGSTGDVAPRYLFDRLLGANLIHEEMQRADPPQRPFDIDSVWKDMATPGRNHLDGLDAHTGHATRLMCARGDFGDLGLLAPSIEHVDLDESEKTVTLHGLFGSDLAKLHVFVREGRGGPIAEGDTELTIDASPDPQTLVCKGLPDRGKGSSGYLVVGVDYGSQEYVQSNVVPISAWRGAFTFTLRLPGQEPESSGIGQITTEVFLRGDIHRSRRRSGEPPQARACVFASVHDPETKARFSSGGDYTYSNGYSYHWHGSGAMPHDGEHVIGVVGWHRHMTSPVNPKLFVNLMTGVGDALVDVKDETGTVILKDLIAPINLLYLAHEVNAPPFISDFLQGSLAWNEADGRYERSYDIPGNTVDRPVSYGIISVDEKILSGRLVWGALKATFIPDDETEA